MIQHIVVQLFKVVLESFVFRLTAPAVRKLQGGKADISSVLLSVFVAKELISHFLTQQLVSLSRDSIFAESHKRLGIHAGYECPKAVKKKSIVHTQINELFEIIHLITVIPLYHKQMRFSIPACAVYYASELLRSTADPLPLCADI